jgi:hypothetical protein
LRRGYVSDATVARERAASTGAGPNTTNNSNNTVIPITLSASEPSTPATSPPLAAGAGVGAVAAAVAHLNTLVATNGPLLSPTAATPMAANAMPTPRTFSGSSTPIAHPHPQHAVAAPILRNNEVLLSGLFDLNHGRTKKVAPKLLISNLEGLPDGLTITHDVTEVKGGRIGWLGLLMEECVKPAHEMKALKVMEVATRYVQFLREEKGCTFIVAITHQSFDKDCNLVQHVKGINLVLGGHEHAIMTRQFHTGKIVVKVGQNAEYVGVLDIQTKEDAPPVMNVDIVHLIQETRDPAVQVTTLLLFLVLCIVHVSMYH